MGIGAVESSAMSAVASTLGWSGSTSSIFTRFSGAYIPWFGWLTLIWRPSWTTVLSLTINPPEAAFIWVVIPLIFEYVSVLPAPVLNLPWISSTIIWFIDPSSPTVSLRFLPNPSPILFAVTKSPTWYPDPPRTMVAPTATPFWTVRLQVASLPAPVTFVKGTSK